MSILASCLSVSLSAQHTTVATQFSVGGANMLDTYLSPAKYRGAEWRLMSEVRRDSRKSITDNGTERLRPLTYALSHEVAFSYLHNQAGNAHEYAGHYDFAYAAAYRWQTADDKLTIYAGATAEAFAGFTYNSHNSSNNPAQGYLSAALGLHAAARYDIRLLGKNFTFGYEARIPVATLMFSPNYGQSYYEIFTQGDYDRNIAFQSLSPFQLRQHFTIDMAVGTKTALRLGYLNDIRQATPNNLKQHHYYNGVTVGIVVKK